MASSGDMAEDQVKKFITCLITADPLVYTIQRLQKDYYETIGNHIPYHKFGYNSLEHFLKSIPDTCVVHGTGSFAQVTLVPSQKSAHINQMVTQQKVNTKGRKKFLPPRRRNTTGCAPTTRGPPSWRPSYNYSFTPNASFSSSSSLECSSVASPPKTTNFHTPNRNIGPRSTSTEVKNTNIENSNAKRTGYHNINSQNVHREYIKPGIRSENSAEKRDYIMQQNKLESRKVKEHVESLIQQQLKAGINDNYPGNLIKTSATSSTKNLQTESLNNAKCYVNRPHNASVLDSNALQNLNINNNSSTQEYSKETSDSGEDTLFNRSKEKLNNLLFHFKSVEEEEEEDTSNVPKRVQCNLRTLISQFNDGIWSSDVPGHYKRLFKKELLYQDYGYTSFIEMCIALKHIFHYVRPETDDFKLYDRSKPLPDSVEKLYTIASYDIGEKVSPQALPDLAWSDFKCHIPENVFEYGKDISSEFIPAGTKVESIFDVVVVEIYDPSKFWFYLGSSDNATPLDELMDRMQTFYNKPENAKEYAVPPGAVREGLYCVQIIYGEYHRARIVRVLADCPDYVRVSYIDYGTVCKVPTKGLCFLHNQFAELHSQAIRCRLANIVPNMKGHPWPRTTSDRFRELVNRRDTKIKISYIDWDEEYVCVFLADVTDSDNVVYINDTLVKEGHAVWDGETQVVPLVLSNFKCKVQNIHLFPTFVELEYGLAPNAGEMYALEDLMAPLQFCIPQYFEPNEEILSSDDDIEQMENSFVETVKDHRKHTGFGKIDLGMLTNPPPIDFDIFGELKEEMVEFCNSANFGEAVSNKEQEEELFCDVEEAAANSEGCEEAAANSEGCEEAERKLEELEPVRLFKQDKELLGSILEKLERYSLLESDHSSGSECGGLPSDRVNEKCDNYNVDSQEELVSPREIFEDKLSTIFEHSEIELDPSEPEPSTPFCRFGLNLAQSTSDFNIFDNPEEFDRTSDESDASDSGRSVSPESFLRTVERISRKDLEEDIEVSEEVNSGPENFSSGCLHSDNPFDINADLKEAFKTFLKMQKKRAPVNTSESSCGQSPGMSGTSEEPECAGNSSRCEESFLKNRGRDRRLKKDNVGESGENNLGKEEIRGVGKTDLDLPFRSNLEQTRSGFVSTLSLNNPFRAYLEVNPDENTDYSSTNKSEPRNIEETTTAADSDYTDSSTANVLKINIKIKETASSKTSDSDGSDYKVFVPRSSQNQAKNEPKQENMGSWVQSPMVVGKVNTPPRVATPPRLFTPPAFIPMGYPQYPQWSNGSGYPVPQYSQWSTGGNYSGPHPSYPHPRDMLRPPPGFTYQGPPQHFPPHMNPRMVHAPPVYPHSGPVYYGPPRHMMPPSATERDFYER